jgi:phytoene dehydrogenase-like protein
MAINRRVVVIGAGMGGLAASIRLARLGFDVIVVEARKDPGGLASGFEQAGFYFDAGPYILLDRPGLEWAFRGLGLELSEHVELRKIEDIYEVESGSARIRFYADLDRTAAGFEGLWPGSGQRYARFVRRMADIYRHLEPILHVSRPGPLELIRRGGLRHAPFLMKSLGSVLEAAELPRPLVNAIGIWTRVAAQTLEEAPSPLAFVPALLHTVGAFYPAGGVSSIPRALARTAISLGVEFKFHTRACAIRRADGRAVGVETSRDEFIACDAVVSNYSGVGTHLELLSEIPRSLRETWAKLPLQSPGACAYLAVKGKVEPPYLRFHLPSDGQICRLFIQPSVIEPELARDGWSAARLLSPMEHGLAERLGEAGQREYLEQMLAESWWRMLVGESRVLATRTPCEWGADYHLYRNSMNPVMSARFMRAGRIPHRSPSVRGLYLAGSSTHPGQWVSFCAISGVLAAELLHKDFADA